MRLIITLMVIMSMPLMANAQTDPITYEYDALGRLSKATYTADNSIIKYTYDENGNRTEVLTKRSGEAASEPDIAYEEGATRPVKYIITPNGSGGYNIITVGG